MLCVDNQAFALVGGLVMHKADQVAVILAGAPNLGGKNFFSAVSVGPYLNASVTPVSLSCFMMPSKVKARSVLKMPAYT